MPCQISLTRYTLKASFSNREAAVRIIVPVVCTLLFLATHAAAQITQQDKVFVTECRNLHDQIQVISHSAADGTGDPMDQRQALMALRRSVDRVGEDALAANLDGLKEKKPSDKKLLLVGQCADALSSQIDALDNYLDTNDPDFLTIARKSEALYLTEDKMIG